MFGKKKKMDIRDRDIKSRLFINLFEECCKQVFPFKPSEKKILMRIIEQCGEINKETSP